MNRLSLIFLALSFLSSVYALAWKPAGNHIMTEWGEAVTPENAWQEYPRPQMERDRWLNLNGLWEYTIADKTAPKPDNFEDEILVPFCMESALSGVGKSVLPEQRIWYKRTFTIPKEWKGQRIILNFGAVDYEAHVWVNGGLIGSHKGGFDSFSFDISEYLKKGENELVVSAWDPTDREEIPTGKQRLNPHGIWYTPVSGIWQTVWIEPVNKKLSVEQIRITPDIDRSEVTIETYTDIATGNENYAVKLSVLSGENEVVSTITRINRSATIKIPHPVLWSPDNPFLYKLKAELVSIEDPFSEIKKEAKKDDMRFHPPLRGSKEESDLYAGAIIKGKPLDVVTSYFGMRKIELGPGKEGQQVIYLNNKPIFHNGTLDQGWWPDGLLTPPSDDAMAFELQYLKDAGFNMLRKHIKVEPARYYYHADRLGIMIWQDMPSAVSNPKDEPSDQHVSSRAEKEMIKKSRTAAQYEHELRSMISSLYNHPSVVMWVIFNEGWGQFDTGRLTDYVRALDDTRLINSVSGWVLLNYGDIYDIHTYDVIPRSPENMPDRAIVVGEYGGIGYAVKDHLWNPGKRNWGYQKYNSQEELVAAYKKKFDEIIRQSKEVGISGAVYTQTSDVEGEVNGLLTYDRKVIKIPAEKLKEIHTKVYEE